MMMMTMMMMTKVMIDDDDDDDDGWWWWWLMMGFFTFYKHHWFSANLTVTSCTGTYTDALPTPRLVLYIYIHKVLLGIVLLMHNQRAPKQLTLDHPQLPLAVWDEFDRPPCCIASNVIGHRVLGICRLLVRVRTFHRKLGPMFVKRPTAVEHNPEDVRSDLFPFPMGTRGCLVVPPLHAFLAKFPTLHVPRCALCQEDTSWMAILLGSGTAILGEVRVTVDLPSFFWRLGILRLAMLHDRPTIACWRHRLEVLWSYCELWLGSLSLSQYMVI